MIIFRPQAANRFVCIMREFVTNAFMTIQDDSTNVSVDYILTPRVNGVGNILIINDTINIYNSTYQNMVEGHFYNMTIYLDEEKTNVIYRDRIFCTEQKVAIQTDPDYFYRLNKDVYQQYDGSNNEYIVL
tara:strand:+ start:223 stop:612 length:390 start_codon:yes stop_codon:yes gene_type:complete